MTATSITAGHGPAARTVRQLALAAGYGIAWQVLLPFSNVLWFLPAGLRLGALWVTPSRQWAWLALGEWAGQAVLTVARGQPVGDPVFVALAVLPFLIYAACVWVLRGGEAQPVLDPPRRMLLLLGTGLACAAAVSPLLARYVPVDGFEAPGSLAGAFAFLYGDFSGQLVLAPLVVLGVRTDLRANLDVPLWRDLLMQAVFAVGVFALLRSRADLAPYVLVFAFAPIFVVAFRRGWAGAALSVAVTGALIELLVRHGLLPVGVTVLQLTFSVIGAGGLVLGAAITELRRNHHNLARQHRELAQANAEIALVADELRSVSQRLVRLEEQGQRELAGELDYELGQAIHALGTRISLAFRDARDEQTLRLLESVREQVREMQDSLRRVLRQLRPQVLDHQGLRTAIDQGPLREVLEDSAVEFETAFYGRIEALDDDARTAIYRICQAAVRDATRQEAARRLRLKLDVMPGDSHRLAVEIELALDASPFAEMPLEPVPLAGISDRVLALRGEYVVERVAPGIRHRVRFECEPSARV
jgi:glucose-6-phosphate-specific signal transduction histidine kinase